MAADPAGLRVSADPAHRGAAAVDGLVPSTVASPASTEEVAALVRAARDRRLAVLPRGGGTWTALGGPPARADLVLETAALDRVVEYEPDDYVVTVEAGMRLADLQAFLAAHRQRVPLDPPGGPACTVGGVLATRRSGPRRLAHGTPRDLALGLHAVLGTGDVYRAGGRVMKNVAGYDLVRLLIGSLGTLGIITRATLRTFALPEARRTLVAGAASPADAFAMARAALDAPGRAAAVEVARGIDLPGVPPGAVVLVLLEGLREVVDRQQREIAARWPPAAVLDGGEGDALWAAYLDRLAGGPVRLSLSVPRGRVEEAAHLALARVPDAALLSHAGSGVIVVVPPALDDLPAAVAALRRALAPLAGAAVVEAAPAGVKRTLDVWGETRGLAFMRRIKATLDPDAILNPGRYVGGL